MKIFGHGEGMAAALGWSWIQPLRAGVRSAPLRSPGWAVLATRKTEMAGSAPPPTGEENLQPHVRQKLSFLTLKQINELI
jgi:hypothetical protein